MIPFFCLMPTYGRKPSLLNNSLACFDRQNYPNKRLLIYDDLGTLARTKVEIDNVIIMSTAQRANSMGAKYNQMIEFISRTVDYFYIAVWDDDDLYLPDYLSSHASCLRPEGNYYWSKPSSILSTYTGKPVIEDGAGRFHGSIAMTNKSIQPIGGWPDTRRGTFDQEFIALMTNRGLIPGDPCDFCPPQYVYRWGSTQAMHSSGMIHEDDYFKYRPQHTEPIPLLKPEFDTDEFETILLQQMSEKQQRDL